MAMTIKVWLIFEICQSLVRVHFNIKDAAPVEKKDSLSLNILSKFGGK